MSASLEQGALGPKSTTAAIAWLVKRLKAARSDSEAHPEGHSNRTFYAGQAIAYENVLSLLENQQPAASAPASGAERMTAGEVDWRKVMRDLLREHDKHICLHEETHRGGVIWTICDHCGRKWADDEGGFQPYEEPAAVTAAWAALKCEEIATPAPATPPGVPRWPGLQLRAALEAAEKCRDLFAEIENDYADPTYECRQGREVADAAIEHLNEALSATPPGVPDSVRALSEALERTKAAADDLVPVCIAEGDNKAAGALQFISGFISDQMAALATQSAGQSAGSGADILAATLAEFQRRNGYHKPEIEELLTEFGELLLSKVQPAPDSTRTGQVGLREALARSLTKSIAGGSPDRYRIEIACPDLATMQVLRDGLVSLRDNPAAITAPHDDGFTADELREIRAAIMELGAGAIRTQKITDHQAANDLQRHCIGRIERALASRLAARPAAPAAPEAQGAWRSRAADDVLAERHRQVEVEGWTPKHDDTHSRGEMACAAACYATGSDLWTGHEQTDRKGRPTLIGAARVWPWSGWWKPADRRHNLVKAGALILAEIERLDRLPAPPSSSGQEG